MRSVLTSVFFFILWGPSTFANPMPVGSTGRSLIPYQLKPVQNLKIIKETVEIRDGLKAKLPSFNPKEQFILVPTVGYRATYVFFNGGKSRTVQIGFPVATYGYNAGSFYGGVDDFSAMYGGEELQVKQQVMQRPTIVPEKDLPESKQVLLKAGLVEKIPELPEFLDLRKLGKDAKSVGRTIAGIKNISAGKLKKIKKEIVGVLYSDDDFGVTSQSVVWYVATVKFPKGRSKSLEFTYTSFPDVNEKFGYILKTGAFWGGSIGDLTVTFIPDNAFLKTSGFYDVLPANRFTKSKSGHFVFKGKDVRPDFDIVVRRRR